MSEKTLVPLLSAEGQFYVARRAYVLEMFREGKSVDYILAVLGDMTVAEAENIIREELKP